MQGAIFLVILTIGYFLYKQWNRYTWNSGAPWEGMPPDVVARVVEFAGVGKKDVFYELGSGDGRVVIAAAMNGAKAYGVEIDLLRAVYSRFWVWLMRLNKKASIIHKNLFDVNLSKATVICCYLLPETHEKLKKKFKKELKKGTKVVAVGFEIEGWKPVAIEPRGPVYGPIFLYKI